MKIIRARDCRTTPWKNSGGSTTENAVAPADASLEDFDWRISMAQVTSDGPFSEFTGIDRTLAVIKGEGLELTIRGNAPAVLDRGSDPISFPGDVPTSARLTVGEVVDLNVMTRRRRFSHRMRRIREPIACGFEANDIAVVLAPDGSVTLATEGTAVTLDAGDAAVLAVRDGPFRILPVATGHCYLVLLREA